MRLGIDIGGTKTHAIALAGDADIVAEVRLETAQGAAGVVATAVRAVERLAELTDAAALHAESIGVGVPGQVDHETGVITNAVNIAVDELPLGQQLRELLQVEVSVENDVNAAALGAYRLSGHGLDSMAYLNLGTGVAAGLVLNGSLWRGAGGIAGEIGHLPIRPDGDRCPCGQSGCLEAYASGSGIARRWAGGGGGDVSALFDAAEHGDPAALSLRDDLFVGVASAIRILVLSVGVEAVVIGGGISALGDRLRSGLVAVLDAWAAPSPFLTSAELASRVRLDPAGSMTAAVGAAMVPRQ